MPTDRIRLGVVGAGQWARAAHLPGLQHHPACALTAVANATRESSAAVAREFGFEDVCADWRELVSRPDLDAVLVAAPVVDHHAIVLAALGAGKHVLCEAALALTAGEAREMLAAAEAAGVRHATTRPRPFLYGGERLRELLAQAELGRPTSLAFSWHGNAWLNADPATNWRVRADRVPPVLVGVPAAILTDLFGDVSRVSARLARLRAPDQPSTHALAPDFFSAQWVFASGLEATLQAGGAPGTPPGTGLSVFCEKGVLFWDWTRPGRILRGRAGVRELEEVGVACEVDPGRAWPFARDFVEALLAGRAPEPDFRAGVRELELIEACVASSARGRWVSL